MIEERMPRCAHAPWSGRCCSRPFVLGCFLAAAMACKGAERPQARSSDARANAMKSMHTPSDSTAVLGPLVGEKGHRTFAIPPEADPAAPFALDVTFEPQEGNFWCWAASGAMVMRFKAPPGVTVSQCQEARMRWPNDHCCAGRCDWTGDPDFPAFGFAASCRERRPLDFDTLRSELKATRPIVFSWIYPGGAEHIMVIVGYAVANGRRWLYVNDPAGQITDVTYDEYAGRVGLRHNRDYFGIRYTGKVQLLARPRSERDPCVELPVLATTSPASPDEKRFRLPASNPSTSAFATAQPVSQLSDSGRAAAAIATASDFTALEGARVRASTPGMKVFSMTFGSDTASTFPSSEYSAAVWIMRDDSIKAYDGRTEDVGRVLEPLPEVVFPLQTAGRVSGTGTMTLRDGIWRPGAIGPSQLGELLIATHDSIERRRLANQREKTVLTVVKVPTFGLVFVAYQDHDVWWLIPTTSRPTLKLLGGSPVLLQRVVQRLRVLSSPSRARYTSAPLER